MKRIGILGPGGIAQIHLACWQQLPVEIAAHYDLRPEMAEHAAQEFGGKACTDLDEFFDLVDIVDICTPAIAHKSNILAAIAAGKPTLCEKPLARHLADCETIVAAVEASGIPFFVAHVVRFFPEYKTAKAAIDSGAIGKPGVIRTLRAGAFPQKLGNFYSDFSKTGGVVLDVAIHDIDFHRWCMGEVERVFTRGMSFTGTPERDHALIMLRFANGGIGHIDTSWVSPPGQWRTALEIAGDEGLIEWDAEGPAPITQVLRNETNDGKVRTTISPIGGDIHPYKAELAHFLACVETGEAPLISAREAMMNVKVALAANESMRLGKPITIADFTEAPI